LLANTYYIRHEIFLKEATLKTTHQENKR